MFLEASHVVRSGHTVRRNVEITVYLRGGTQGPTIGPIGGISGLLWRSGRNRSERCHRFGIKKAVVALDMRNFEFLDELSDSTSEDCILQTTSRAGHP